MPHRVVVSSLGPAFTFFLKLNGYCLFPGFNKCPQRPVDPRLVAVSFFLEPGQHIRVQTKCDRFLQRLIELRQVVTEIMRAFPIVGGSLKPGDLAAFGNSHVPFHLSVYVYLCTDSIASTNVPRGTLRRLCRPMHQAALQLTLSCVRKRMRSGDRPGLQNRRVAGYPVTGGFDSHSLPPLLFNCLPPFSSLAESLGRELNHGSVIKT